MHLTLHPSSSTSAPTSTLSVAGDVLTLDGTPYDLSGVPEGGEGIAPDDWPFFGPIRRIGGVIHATVRITLGVECAQVQPTDPAHWVIEATDGPVTLPAIRKVTA
jgi:hypothetical protein